MRLFLPKEEFAEPVEINLKDARDVKAESLAYKVIPSMPRDVGCDKDGFRQDFQHRSPFPYELMTFGS